MKLLGSLAAGFLALLLGVLCVYEDWTVLRCLRCGKWGLARQLRLGPDVVLYGVEEADHAIPLWPWRLDSGASLDPLSAKYDINADPAPFRSPRCQSRGHLWLGEQTYKRGLLIERSGSCGMSWRGSDPMFRGLDRWSEPGFREFCRRAVGNEDAVRALLLPGDAVYSEASFLTWDARLGKVLRAYDARVADPYRVEWKPADWDFAQWRREGTRFAWWH